MGCEIYLNFQGNVSVIDANLSWAFFFFGNVGLAKKV